MIKQLIGRFKAWQRSRIIEKKRIIAKALIYAIMNGDTENEILFRKALILYNKDLRRWSEEG